MTGRTALIAGWGLLRQDSLDYPDVPLQVELPVLSNEKCTADYAGEPFTITDNMVCAGLPEGGKDTCQVSMQPAVLSPQPTAARDPQPSAYSSTISSSPSSRRDDSGAANA